MTAHELLSQLRAKGVELKTSGDDRLIIDAPKGTITEELRNALSANKADLIHILKTEQEQNQQSAADNRIDAPPPTTAVHAEGSRARVPAPDKSTLVAASIAEEVAQLQTELMRLRTEEEARRSEVEASRLAAEHALRN